MGISLREPAMRLEISAPAVGDSVERGEDTQFLVSWHSIHVGKKISMPIFESPKAVG